MKNYALLLFALSLLTLSCKKGIEDDGTLAGKGGYGTLKVTPRHHSRQIDSCMIYIKYNAVDAPVDNRYDDSAKTVLIGGIPVATFTELKKGNYYLYGYGWDPKLTPPAAVKGGFAYPLQTENEQSYDLAVSED